jgi:putative membrane protein
MKKYFLYFMMLALIFSLAAANVGHDFTEAKQLVDSKTSCNELTENQLEHIGDYYMEQMHPGESHERMDNVMGGEGSESLRQMHIALAKRMYCNDISGMAQYGMGGMIGRGMIGDSMQTKAYARTRGMMSGFGPLGWHWGYAFLFNIVFWAIIVWLIVWIIIKSKKSKQSPIEILKARYANGELSKKQFEKMKKEIK